MNLETLKPFTKDDPRINRKGRRIGSKKQLRSLIVEIANQPVKDGDAKTKVERFVENLFKSDNPSDKRLLLEYYVGKVADEQEVKSDNKITLVVKYADTDDKPTEAA